MSRKTATLIAARRGAERDLPVPLWLIFFVPLLALALFLGKPFHIDDVTFIKMGEMLPWTIIGENVGKPAWFLGQYYSDLSPYESTHPVLIPYFLKWLGLLQNSDGPTFFLYHLFFLVFPALAIFFSLVLSKSRQLSFHWVWYLVLSPIFFVNATNLMIDIAMLSFWLGSVFLVVTWAETGKTRFAVGSSVCLTAALLTSYQSVCLFPLMVAYLLIRGNLNRQSSLILIIPAIILTVYLVLVYRVSGFFPFISSSLELNIAEQVGSGIGWPQYIHKIFAALVFLGLGLIFVTPLVISFLSTRRFLIFLALSLVYCVVLLRFGREQGVMDGYDHAQTFCVWLLMLNGIFWVWLMFAKTVDGLRLLLRKRRVRAAWLLTACFWFLGVLVYNILFLPYGTARYILPALPGALMIVFIKSHYRRMFGLEWILLTLSLALSLFMSRVDYQQALADYRLFQQVKQDTASEKIWYSDDAGLSLYLPIIGAQYLTMDQATLSIGDKVLETRGLIPGDVYDNLALVRDYQFESFMGWSLFNTSANAGFYRSYDGLLPMWRAPLVRDAKLLEVDFFRTMKEQAEILQLSHPDYFDYRTFDFSDKKNLSVMYLHPDSVIGFPLTEQMPYTLTGSVVSDPASWEREGDGVDCWVGVRIGQEDHVLWHSYIDGKNQVNDRSPREFHLNIPESARLIWFKVGAGPAGDYRYDGMGWGSLKLVPDQEI